MLTSNSRTKARPHTLSTRGRELVTSPPFAEYLREHFERSAEGYDPVANPEGYIDLCIAENKLSWDLLAPKVHGPRDTPHRALCYDAMTGSHLLRTHLSRFMGRTFLGREFDAQNIAVLAGAGAVLEILFYALCDPGDAVLVPTPSYAGFWADLETRDGIAIIPVPGTSSDGFRLTLEGLDQALLGAQQPVKALLFTTPDNPLGRVYGADEIEAILNWAAERGLQVVFDEIYALSVFGQMPFTSCATVRPNLGHQVHIVWAFSKDFGASGLRCGVLVSENEEVLRAVDALSYWACCSGDTQWLLGEMVSDDTWVDAFIAGNRARLAESYERTVEALRREGIPFVPSQAGFFLLCDMRPFMSEVTWQGESELWRQLLDRTNVNLTPGSACRIAEPGFMRLCFAAHPPGVVETAIRRVGRTLQDC
jgi:aspartate/methionine/tyrosine aminotransferase